MTETREDRILTLYIPDNIDEKLKLANYIIYRGKKITLVKTDVEELLNTISEYWHSTRDRLIHFSVSSDGGYLCERVKETYNYYTKETEDKSYYFDTADKTEIQGCVDSILLFFEKKTLSTITNLQEKFVAKLKDLNYFKAHLLDMRQTELEESDYMFTADYPLEETEKQKWQIFRQELRDITEQEEWKNGDYLNVSFPLSPDLTNQAKRVAAFARIAGFDEGIDFTSETTTSAIIKDYGKLVVKMKMIQVLADVGSKTGRQMLGMDLPEFNFSEERKIWFANSVEPLPEVLCPLESGLSATELTERMVNHNMIDRINDYTSQIESIIQQIDPGLSVANIWELALDMVKSSDINDKVDDLLAELESETELQGE